MIGTTIPSAELDEPTASGRRFRADQIRVTLRLAVLLGLTVLAGWSILVEAWRTVMAGSPFQWVLLAPAAAIPVAFWRHHSLTRRVHVHDRHFDLLVSIGLLVVVITTLGLLVQRLGWAAGPMRLELLMAPVWIAAVAIALFGVRPVVEQAPALWLCAAVWPFPYTVMAAQMPIHTLPWLIVACVATMGTAAAYWTAPGRLLLVTAIALLTVAGFAMAFPSLAPAELVIGPGIVWSAAKVFGWSSMRQVHKRDPRPAEVPLANRRGRRSAIALLAVAAVVAVVLARSPSPIPRPISDQSVSGCPQVPEWRALGDRTFGGGPQRHGGDWRTRRCTYRVSDQQGDRDIALDVTEPISTIELQGFPLPVVLQGPGELDPVQRTFELRGGRVSAFVFSDPKVPTELTVLNVDVAADPGAHRRVSLLVPDDRRPGVSFPIPHPRPLVEVLQRLADVVRTQDAQLRRYAVEPKDLPAARMLLSRALEAWGRA